MDRFSDGIVRGALEDEGELHADPGVARRGEVGGHGVEPLAGSGAGAAPSPCSPPAAGAP